jgi:hypothetical protein
MGREERKGREKRYIESFLFAFFAFFAAHRFYG